MDSRKKRAYVVSSDDEDDSKKNKDPDYAPRRPAAGSYGSSSRSGRRREQQQRPQHQQQQMPQNQQQQRHIVLGVTSRDPRGLTGQIPSSTNGLNSFSTVLLKKCDVEPRRKTIISWLLDQKMIVHRERVQYKLFWDETKVLMDGIVKGDGILCSCCNRVVSVDVFEGHARENSESRPYQHIFLSSGKSLFQCQIEAWNKQEEVELRDCNLIRAAADAVDASDDACLICGDGGDLICCEMCPSTFDLKCLDLQDVPQDDWLCSYCVCRFCRNGGGVLYTCVQCEKKFHSVCCTQEFSVCCTQECLKVYRKLQSLIGEKHEVRTGMSWTLIRRMIPEDHRFHNEYLRTECNSKIALSWQVLNECFHENIDRHTRINVVQSVAYNKWSNFMRINFRGFYTAILEVDGSIASAACIRVHGTEFAEMPFIGTLENLRNKGYSTVLISELERTLSSLGVAKLVIPSIEEVEQMWKEKHGFTEVDDLSKRELMHFNPLMFPTTKRLQKSLSRRARSFTAENKWQPESSNMAVQVDLNMEPIFGLD